MKVPAAIYAVAALAAFVGDPAMAHDSHDEDDRKLMPSACAHLGDAKRYVTDSAYPEVKALKTRCDKEQKSVDKAVKPVPPKPAEKG